MPLNRLPRTNTISPINKARAANNENFVKNKMIPTTPKITAIQNVRNFGALRCMIFSPLADG
jgi:hypothetical protein